jgi:hypothetical protein
MANDFVWVFNGGGAFPSGVFSSREKAERWISENKLTGTLTLYPVDIGVWQWAVQEGYFKPTRDDQHQPKFVQHFSCGHEHYHYEDGE